MSSAVVKRLPKPNWNNCQRKHMYSQVYQAIAFGSVVSGAIYYFMYLPRLQKTIEYNKNYDPFAEMERMRNLGLFSSAPPDYVIEEQKQKELAKAKKK